jgi:hypothetical protein
VCLFILGTTVKSCIIMNKGIPSRDAATVRVRGGGSNIYIILNLCRGLKKRAHLCFNLLVTQK